MRTVISLLLLYIFFMGITAMTVDKTCEETVEILKQRIEVQEMTNTIQMEMIRKKDSIITIQDSLIISLKIRN